MKRFVAVLVGLALAMSARPAAARELSPAEDLTSSPPSPHAAAFATGKDVSFDSVELRELTGTAASCDDDGALDTGESARVRVTLRNSGTERLERTSMTLSSDDPDLSFPEGQTVSFPAAEPLQLFSAELTVKLSGAPTQRELSLNIAYRDAEQQVPGDKTHTAVYRVNTDALAGTSSLETAEALHHPWTVTASPAGIPPWTILRDPASANGFFRGPDNKVATDLALVSPPLQVSQTETFRVIFQQRYVFEKNGSGIPYDGAVIELSEDEGRTWVDLGTSVSPTYDATLAAGGENPLRGRQAYGGQSPGYPAFTKATVSLGTSYAGKTVRIRFRIGTDTSTGATGWDLDDLQLEGVVNTPFATLVAHRGECINRAPVANAGPDQTVNEGSLVTLSGSGTDPEGGPLTYEWTQTQGEPVKLSDASAPNPTFLAPDVTRDTDFQFELRVRDEVNTSPPDVVAVRVRDPSPVASVEPVAAVDEGTRVTLKGSASNADGGTEFVYTWTQVDGPPITLSDSTSATPSFTAPQVDTDTTLTLQLVVGDGKLESAPVTVSVLVRNVRNAPPVARAGGDQSIREGSGVTLDGSASKDPEGSALSYTWTQVDGPTVNLMLAGPRATFNTPDVDEETALTFLLQVTDEGGESGEDTVTVRVSNREVTSLPGSGCGCAAGQEGGVPTTVLLLLAALGFALRRPG